MDIRYNFLNTLDHFPCELIRTLWVLQSLDLQRESISKDDWTNAQMLSQSQLLNDLVSERLHALTSHREDLVELLSIRKKYDSVIEKEGQVKAQSRSGQPAPKLTIKLNLRQKISRGRGDKISSGAKVRNREAAEDEETYCICHKVSYGAMIACDNLDCATEWFHYGCVGITKPPQGKWYCSDSCRLQVEARKKGVKKSKRRRLN